MPKLIKPERDELIYNMKEKEGKTFRQIAEITGFSLGGLHQMYNRHKQRLAQEESETVDKEHLTLVR